MANETYSKPGEVVVAEGRVLLDGPDHVDVALTPEAAQQTGERLIQAAARAEAENQAADLEDPGE